MKATDNNDCDDSNMWPEGPQRWEQVQGQENSLWAASNFAWHSMGSRKHNESYTGKAEVRKCLGVFKCKSCQTLVRPKTRAYKDQLAERCSCGGALLWTKCDAQTWYFPTRCDDSVEYLVWEHVSSHFSPDRPPAGRLSAEQWAAVDKQTARHHDATAFQLRNGDLRPGSVPLASIAPKLASTQSARYAVARSRENQGINVKAQRGTAGILRSFSNLTKELSTPFLVNSSVDGPVYIVMSTPFMQQILNEAINDWIADAKAGLSVGWHGFVNDGDHKFFRHGNLLVTLAWSPVITSWVPILYSWVDHLDTEHHRPHFQVLFRSVIEHAGDSFDKKLLANVGSGLRFRYCLFIVLY